ncbi:hypothetical protein [Aquimarina algicola]|uniref:Uncharacterized protein n=1 Tax=Aquimarina algicola TaxID=2589995 RepID=A0A504J6P6_9FLAO|nr:hypothetical protein [Aquimarina algicola]TPN82390.1 hypothetical protein FHK87_23505 [Aquimarina algicola]
MDRFESEKISKKIEELLKRAIDEVLCMKNPYDIKKTIVQTVQQKLNTIKDSFTFRSYVSDKTEIKKISYTLSNCDDGMITGKVIVKHAPKPDKAKYGGPGYPGKEDGQLCKYPELNGEIYKWSSFSKKWVKLYDTISRGDSIDPNSISYKMAHNAVFGPIWGQNPNGNDFRSGRHANGGDILGSIDPRQYLGTFTKVSGNALEAIFKFTLNVKSVIEQYVSIKEALGYKNDNSIDKEDIETKEIQKSKNKNDTVSYDLEIKKTDPHRDNLWINSAISTVKGLNNAKKDSTYHVQRSTNHMTITVEIKQKYGY